MISIFHQTRAIVQFDETDFEFILDWNVISITEQQMFQALYRHASVWFPAFCVLWCDSNNLSDDIIYVFLDTVWSRLTGHCDAEVCCAKDSRQTKKKKRTEIADKTMK